MYLRLVLVVVTCSFLLDRGTNRDTKGFSESSMILGSKECILPESNSRRTWGSWKQPCPSFGPCLLDVFHWKCMRAKTYLACHSCTCINTSNPLTQGVINYTAKISEKKGLLQQSANEADQYKFFLPFPEFHSRLFTLLSEIKQLCLHS